MSAQAACLGAKDSKSPTIATLVASTVNVVGDAALVLGPLSLGIAGAAWATVGCQVVAAGLLLRTLRAKGLVDGPSLRQARPGLSAVSLCCPQSAPCLSAPPQPPLSAAALTSARCDAPCLGRTCSPRPTTAPPRAASPPQVPSRAELRRFFAFGAFVFVLLSKQLCYNQGVLLATILGTTAGAAHQCLYSLFRLCCTLGDVTGATAQAFLPQYYKTDEATGKVSFDASAARGTIRRIVGMSAIVAACNTAITFSIPIVLPGIFTADRAVVRLMRAAAPIAAAGLLMHPSVVGMEGCLLATREIRWLISIYVATGTLSLLATQLLLKLTPLRRRLDLNAIWLYLAAYQGVRFVTFAWRLLASDAVSGGAGASGEEE